MRLDPGPIPPLSASWLDTSIDQPGFTGLVTAQLAGVDPLEQQMDALVDPAATFELALPDDGVMSALDQVDQINGDHAALAGEWQIAPLDAYKTQGDAAILDAVQNTPGEAWTPVPEPAGYEGPAPAPPSPGAPGVTIANLTRPGASDFFEGEQYEITVQMPTEGLVLAQYYQTQVQLYWWSPAGDKGNFSLGTTDLNGRLGYSGVWPAGSAGWHAAFVATSSDGSQTPGPYDYDLQISPPPITGRGPGTFTRQPPGAVLPQGQRSQAIQANQPIQVYLVNITAPGSQNFRVGDAWTLDIYGPPASPVEITATKDGQPLAPALVGSTDASGHLAIQGRMSSAELGAWVEFYRVGAVQWQFSLAFQVTP